MNFIQVIGNLGADAETRVTPSGLKVTNLRMASTTRRGGEEETIWYEVTLWGDKYDKMLPYLKKGSGLIVFGELSKPKMYTDKEGRQQISPLKVTGEVIKFMPSSGRGDKGAVQEKVQTEYAESSATAGNRTYLAAMDEDDDGLPF